MSHYPKKVKIVEVSPRDGLQNESQIIDPEIKIEFVNRLSRTGLSHIEVSSFVSAKRIPQLADAEAVFAGLLRSPGVTYSALVPNEQGMTRALAAKVDAIAVFTAASETFSQKNIRCSINDAFSRFSPLIDTAKHNALPLRGYISCVLGCPYEGYISPHDVAEIAERLFDLGCIEISLGDTIGAGTPTQTELMLDAVLKKVPQNHIAVHFHNTRGQALANILTSLHLGITTIDTSVAGLGGCPYAQGSTGNVATEDVVYMLHGMGIKTNIALDKLIETGHYISQHLDRDNMSHVGQAGVPHDYASYQVTQ